MSSYIEQCDDYWIAEDDLGYGNALILKSSWSNHYLVLIAKYNIKVVRLNERLGWHDSNLSFLPDIPGIHGVDVLSENVHDVSPIFELPKLKTLSLYCRAKVAGDFSKLEKLERVSLAWRNVYESIFELITLRRINVLGFPDRDLFRWKRNAYLKELRLESKKLETLSGIVQFPRLGRLDLFRCRVLSSLDAIAHSTNLQSLRINCCPRLHNLSPISHLTEMRELEIENCREIQTLAPLCRCKKLKSLRITGTTTVVDGDLRCLKRLRNLKTVFLVHRKHYSHTDDELVRK